MDHSSHHHESMITQHHDHNLCTSCSPSSYVVEDEIYDYLMKSKKEFWINNGASSSSSSSNISLPPSPSSDFAPSLPSPSNFTSSVGSNSDSYTITSAESEFEYESLRRRNLSPPPPAAASYSTCGDILALPPPSGKFTTALPSHKASSPWAHDSTLVTPFASTSSAPTRLATSVSTCPRPPLVLSAPTRVSDQHIGSSATTILAMALASSTGYLARSGISPFDLNLGYSSTTSPLNRPSSYALKAACHGQYVSRSAPSSLGLAASTSSPLMATSSVTTQVSTSGSSTVSEFCPTSLQVGSMRMEKPSTHLKLPANRKDVPSLYNSASVTAHDLNFCFNDSYNDDGIGRSVVLHDHDVALLVTPHNRIDPATASAATDVETSRRLRSAAAIDVMSRATTYSNGDDEMANSSINKVMISSNNRRCCKALSTCYRGDLLLISCIFMGLLTLLSVALPPLLPVESLSPPPFVTLLIPLAIFLLLLLCATIFSGGASPSATNTSDPPISSTIPNLPARRSLL